jgi:catechol 2,3-dioxygenase-like lactoylglutathione lyase family enzyme
MTPVHHAINYVEITVTDMDGAQHFYGAAFGWRFTDYAPAYAGIQAPKGDGEVGGLSLGQNVEPGGPLVCSTPTTSTLPSLPSRMPAGGSPRSRTHSRADDASPSSTRARTGSAYGAQPSQHAVQADRSGEC